MTDCLHHFPEVRRYFHEAVRCLRPGGRILMVEPWVTRWSAWIYGNFHHEPFLPDAASWEFPPAGPLSGANGAIPWIVFERDRAAFEREFPQLVIRKISPFMPFRYLASGGITLRSLAPAWTFSGWRGLEKIAGERKWAMFAFLSVERR
jgi:SAM-dependent methyltransferase